MKKLIAAVILLAVSTAQADTIYVDVNCPGGDGSIGDPFCTIQTAVDAALFGDVVIIADGTYTGVGNRDVVTQGKSLSIQSANGPLACVIDCEGLGRAFSVDWGTSLTGLTIKNGFVFADDGGGIHCLGTIDLINCRFENNFATGSGGAVYVVGGETVMSDCVFTGNSSDADGGGVYLEQGEVTVTNSDFYGNSAPSSNGGGGLYTRFVVASVVDCSFTNNTAARGGGGTAPLTARRQSTLSTRTAESAIQLLNRRHHAQ